MVPNAVLQNYGDLAFEIHGQHGQQRLLKARNHLHIFEEQTGLGGDFADFAKAMAEFRAAFRHFWELKDGEAERLKEIDFIDHQLTEIDGIAPSEEDRELEDKLRLARNHELIRAREQELHNLLSENLIPDLKRCERLVREIAEFKAPLKPYLNDLESLTASFGELQAEFNDFQDPDDNAEVELAHLEARETALNRLFMKYGRDLDEVLAERERLQQRATELKRDSSGLEQQWSQLSKTYAALCTRKTKLDRSRQTAIKGFARAVKDHLRDLALKGASFEIGYTWPDWPAELPQTRDLNLAKPDFEFLFSPNPGEPVKPISRVASGGELSRVLLALISAFQRNGARMLVFDEIDAGLGGETAHAAGAKLAGLGKGHQVVCVTHFAQVARYANQQVKIEKRVRGKRTFTSLVVCDYQQRIAELARLMGGDADSESLREHARDMLAQ
jgi:DNA repair protein RecN (Recombination protein N)